MEMPIVPKPWSSTPARAMFPIMARLSAVTALLVVGAANLPAGATEARIPDLTITRIESGIVLDGRLTEPAWRQAGRVEEWYETAPGDNVTPKVQTTGYLAYDGHYLYVGFDCRDPDPKRIRAPLADRDSLTGNVDHVGVLIDSRNDGKTAMLFATSAAGVQYDSIWNDSVATDDTAPDFHWDAAAHVDERGWTLEMRIPLSSLRYTDRNPASWGISLYRIYPREFWYRIVSASSPRGVDCWVCLFNRVTGLHGLPPGGGVVVTPYLSGRSTSAGDPGAGLGPAATSGVVGGDLKWTPNAGQAFDLTVKPDFSQIESDAAQISANERFALFYAEKRPFFLEGRDLLSTPLQPFLSLSTPVQPIYTRTITSPEWGGRNTGRFGQTSYTVLLANDRGGGSVVLPAATGSASAPQDFRSNVLVGRVRRDLGASFLGVVSTNRWIDGGGENHVVGPDFQWRPSSRDTITGQWLVSRSTTPRRPDLAEEWDGRRLSGTAGELRWWRRTRHYDWLGDYRDVGGGFRADNGFVPQVGYREVYAEAGGTVWPARVLQRLRFFALVDHSASRGRGLLSRQHSAGVAFNGPRDSFGRIRLSFDRVLTGPVVLPRTQLVFDVGASPSRRFTAVELTGTAGGAIDFDGHRRGTGADISAYASLQATRHLEFRLNASRRFVDLPGATGTRARLFTARIERVRATYAFTRRALLRLIAQRSDTRRTVALYREGALGHEAALDLSALFSFKLNWQTVLFVGYGDTRALADDDRLEPRRRELFAKVSYAFQR
jgi:Domain of unknown function (DUF5916)/Carbohydrate family 9 binding domain-like